MGIAPVSCVYFTLVDYIHTSPLTCHTAFRYEIHVQAVRQGELQTGENIIHHYAGVGVYRNLHLPNISANHPVPTEILVSRHGTGKLSGLPGINLPWNHLEI